MHVPLRLEQLVWRKYLANAAFQLSQNSSRSGGALVMNCRAGDGIACILSPSIWIFLLQFAPLDFVSPESQTKQWVSVSLELRAGSSARLMQ